ncbi:unnamed protein product [Pieris macdunnoughi]|uniref:tRNA-splicing endonuclease subunit Sen54 N-terminal domain-containing protein n=1 Tax=Pieris macdunnoughi TaxID=345717 RepID=A0A821QDL6_9NEOP|nr:unnamed protein product [Pieris macdunnoughi]
MAVNNILTGEDLVKKGVTRLEANLPELGLKDVVPNGSWLESKQIQAALEEKKHLIEVERIEKRGSLSQADWQEDLSLAEVTQKVGGYWQFLGHNVGPILYLKPEEALFLMEINCLQLNYGGVKVSLQQAYSLLLRGELNILKYKVYASLSRVGYKVLRHKSSTKSVTQLHKVTEAEKCTVTVMAGQNNEKCQETNTLSKDLKTKCYGTFKVIDSETNINSINNNYSIDHDDKLDSKMSKTYKNVIEIYHNKIDKLKSRVIKPPRNEQLNEFFFNIPELLGKHVVTLKVPEAKFLPDNMKLKETYTINLQNFNKKYIKRRNRTYSLGDEVNNSHVGRLQSDSNNFKDNINTNQAQSSVYTQTSSQGQKSTQTANGPQIPNSINHNNYVEDRHYEHSKYMPVFYSRPQNLNYINFNMIFDNTLNHVYFPYQCYGPQVCPGPSLNVYNSRMYGNRMQNSTIQRSRGNHLQRIKDLAGRLKILVSRGNSNKDHIRDLKNLLKTYNSRYKTKLRLSSDFEILTEASVVAQIDLDQDDDEPQNKRQKTDNSLEENLQAVTEMALELKDLEINGKATASHRRSISKLIKTFNDCYNVEYYLTPGYEVLNRADVSSVTKSVIVDDEEPVNKSEKPKKSKKFRNPYNILKRLSENQGASSSKSNFPSILNKNTEPKNSSKIESWIPYDNNFVRIEIPSEIGDPLFDSRKTQMLYEFIKFKPNFLNWGQAKIAFLESLMETIAEFSQSSNLQNDFDEDCLLSPDCGNVKAVMDKLRIIKTNEEASSECRLHIDFDVYNRNVENYKKKNPPKPHFRVICLDESLEIPSASEVEALESRYEDNIPIVFALVSSSSISYLQVKSTEIPIFEASSNQ